VREVAAVGTWFILVNSAVGLTAIWASGKFLTFGEFSWLPAAVAVGGLVGSRLLQGMMNEMLVRRVTGVLVLLVAVRVLCYQVMS